MNRCARFFRTAGGFLLLTELAVLFLPVLVISQENYPAIRYSQFSFIKELFGNTLEIRQKTIIAALILLPSILALVMGIIGVVGSSRQIVSGIGAIAVFGLNVAFYFNLKELEPARMNDAQIYSKDFGLWLSLGLSGAAAVCGIVGLIVTPRRQKVQTENSGMQPQSIMPPELQAEMQPQPAMPLELQTEMQPQPIMPLEQQAEMQLQSTAQSSVQAEVQPQIQVQGGRGVMVGLSGDYQGAEIPFTPGEILKIGRDISNDLIFANAKRVSRFHCALSWLPEEQKFQIVDKSSNGSFVNGMEECLPQNIAIYLEPGTILDIGNAENRFRLE